MMGLYKSNGKDANVDVLNELLNPSSGTELHYITVTSHERDLQSVTAIKR